MLKRLLTGLAMGQGRAIGAWRRFAKPTARDWADYLRRHGGLAHLGEGCVILPDAKIIDPALTWIGNRVCLGACTLICHDGSIEMIAQRYGAKLDRLGPIVLEDDVYIGENAIIVAGNGVRIGEGSIIGAGAVVRSSVPAGSIVTGNPGKVVGKVADLLRFWEAEMLDLPWASLIAARESAFDPAIEPELQRLRQAYFFPGGKPRT